MKECQKRAKAKYRKKIVFLRVELYPTDSDIITHMTERKNAGEGKATYIKRLIREDIKKAGLSPAFLCFYSVISPRL